MASGKVSTIEYNGIAKILHWVIAALIILQVVLAKLAEESSNEVQELALLVNHRSVGITVLCLAFVRLAWRFFSPPPPPVVMPEWQRIASQVAHWAMYALIFLVPLSGWLMSSADGVAIEWFGVIPIPDLVAANGQLEELFEETHEILAKILIVVALLHIAAGLKHGLVDKDESVRRISSTLSVATFLAIVVLGIVLLA
jgi:cytochrome b561